MEKVRSASMAMHKSNELQGVVNTVIDQLKDLHIELDTSNILIFNQENKNLEYWTSSNSTGTTINSGWQVPYINLRYFRELHAAHRKRDEIYHQTFPAKEKNKMFSWLFNNTDFRNLPEERKKFILKSERSTFLAAIVKDIAIHIISYSKESFSASEIEVLKRFAKVFHQAYTRFLDLKKAEEQAREAEIQLALERVRSAAMSMHSSDELSHTITVLFKQLNILGINPINTYLVLYDLDNNQFSFRMTGKGGSQLAEMSTFSFDKLPGFKPAVKAWKSGVPVIEAQYLGDERKKWLALIKPMNSKLPKEKRLRLSDFPTGIYSCSGRHDFGSLGIIKDKKSSQE